MVKSVFFTMDLAAAIEPSGGFTIVEHTTYHSEYPPHVDKVIQFPYVTAKVHYDDGDKLLISVDDYMAATFAEQLGDAVVLAAWER